MYSDGMLNFVDISDTELGTLGELRKALYAGTGTDSATFIGGRALQIQDLEMTLINAVFSQDEAKLYKRMKMRNATATVHEFTRRDEVGADFGGVAEEGGSGMETDQDLKRITVPMKTLQTKRAVTLHMLASQAIDDAKASEKLAGTLTLLRRLEKNLFVGDSLVVPAEFDGLQKSIPGNYNLLTGSPGDVAEQVIDLRGKAIDDSTLVGEYSLTTAARLIRDAFGKADAAYMSLTVMQDIQKLIRERVRFPILQPNQADTATGALFTNNWSTPFGMLELIDDVFLRERGISITSTMPLLKPMIPGAVTPTAGAPTPPVVSLFITGVDNGSYRYMVTSENKYGESDPVYSAVTAVAAGEVVTFSIAVCSGAGSMPTGYRIYRSEKDVDPGTVLTGYKLIGRFPWIGDPTAAAATNGLDQNAVLPDTSDIYVLTTDPMYQALEWLQFLPLMEFTLYPTETAMYPFLIMLVGALATKIPKRHVRIMNVGHTGGWYS